MIQVGQVGRVAARILDELTEEGYTVEQILAICRTAADMQLNAFVAGQQIESLLRTFSQNKSEPRSPDHKKETIQ